MHPAEVQKILDQVDWSLFEERLGWRISRPSCSFYDGDLVCPAWQSWIECGTPYFETEEQHVEAVRDALPSEPLEEIQAMVSAGRREHAGELTGVSFTFRRRAPRADPTRT